MSNGFLISLRNAVYHSKVILTMVIPASETLSFSLPAGMKAEKSTDAEAISAFYGRMNRTEFTPEYLKKRMTLKDEFYTVVSEGKIVSCMALFFGTFRLENPSFYVLQSSRNTEITLPDDSAYFGYCITDPAVRGQGCFSSLFAFVSAELYRRGIRRLIMTTGETNRKMISIAEKFGGKIVARTKLTTVLRRLYKKTLFACEESALNGAQNG